MTPDPTFRILHIWLQSRQIAITTATANVRIPACVAIIGAVFVMFAQVGAASAGTPAAESSSVGRAILTVPTTMARGDLQRSARSRSPRSLKKPSTVSGESFKTAHGGGLIRGVVNLPGRQVWRAKLSSRPWCGVVKGKPVPGIVVSKTRQRTVFLAYSLLSKNYSRLSFALGTGGNPLGAYQLLANTFRMYSGKGVQVERACRARPLRTNLRGAIGIAIGPGKTTRGGRATRDSGRGLQAILADGSLRDAVESGVVSPNVVGIAPDGSVIVGLSSRVDLADTTYVMGGEDRSAYCGVIRIGRATDEPRCLDHKSEVVRGSSESGRRFAPFQFDAEGNVYYIANVCVANWTSCSDRLRRVKGANVTSLTDQNAVATDFAVLPDGSVLVAGYTKATNAGFSRLLNSSGAISTLPPPAPLSNPFYATLADGNVYMQADTAGAIARFLTASSGMDARLWIGPTSATPHLDWTAFCDSLRESCPSTPELSSLVTASPSGKAFTATSAALIQIYPSLATFPIAVSATTMTSIGENVLISGMTAGREYQLVRFDATTGTTSIVASRGLQSGEIDFYHVIADEGQFALFDGLRFADNTYVIGRINFITGETEILATTTGKLEDFRLF